MGLLRGISLCAFQVALTSTCVLAPALPASAQTVVSLSLEDAMRQAAHVSGAVQSAQLDVQAKTLKAEAVSRINGPSLSFTALESRLSADVNLDTSSIASAVNGIGSMLPGLPIPEVPNSINRNFVTNLTSVGLTSVWPLYTGGRLEAIKGIAKGMSSEAEAERQDAEEQLATQVAERYFLLALAKQVVQVRQEAVTGISEHLKAAKKLEAIGLISRAERLRADVALDGAKSDAEKAQSDVEIAQVALNRLLASSSAVLPSTPLFLHSTSVGTLQSFIDKGLTANAAWKKIASKREQARSSLQLQGHAFSPNVFALGNYNFNRSTDNVIQPTWFVGIAVQIPIVGRIDTSKMIQAAKLDQERVEITAQQAQRDIPTLIEKNWRTLENARIQFLSTASSVELAKENIKLQEVAFKQGQVPVLDEIDARLNLVKVETQRVQTAYSYVMALAQLLEACGEPESLVHLAQTADIVFPSESH